MAKKGKRGATETRKQVRVRERERKAQQQLYLALSLVAALVVIILAFGYWRFNIAILNDTIASVNGKPITVRRYQARARYEAQQITARLAQLQSALSQFDANDPTLASIVQYYQNQYAQEQARLLEVSNTALEELIDDELVRQEAERRGLTVTPEEIDREIELRIKDNLGYPRPTPTSTAGPSPTATSTATPTLSPTPTATPSLSPTATATLSATLTATPTRGSTSTPEPTQTPLSAEAYQAELAKFKEELGKANYTFEDYRAIVQAQLLRHKLNQVLANEIPTTAEQVHVRHILVKTFQEAQQVLARLKAGEDFGKLAEELSIDPSAKTNRGDLDWAPRGYFVQEFEEAAFALEPLQISQPVTTTFGVHIIQLLEKDANRALAPEQLALKRASALDEWLKRVRASAETKIERFFMPEYIPGEIRRLQTPQPVP